MKVLKERGRKNRASSMGGRRVVKQKLRMRNDCTNVSIELNEEAGDLQHIYDYPTGAQ